MVDDVLNPAAIGVRDHSGWAVAIVLASADGTPRMIARDRIQIVSPDLSLQPYHAVAEEGAPRDTIRWLQVSARQLASHAIDRIQERVRVGGFRIIARPHGDDVDPGIARIAWSVPFRLRLAMSLRG